MAVSKATGDMWGEADFVGGHPALDFLNTVVDSGKTRDINKVPDWNAVQSWAIGSDLLSDAELERFLKNGSLDGADELTELIRLREIAYAAMLDLTGKETPNRDAMDILEHHIRAAIERGTFDVYNGRFNWRPNAETKHRWTDAVSLALEQLLRSDDLNRVRQCVRCTWFFIDRGRGTGRRWCDMRTCGNRAKAEAFRSR